MKNTKTSKYAFTLAEVLITLTIIGVIAAITIPNLMQSWKKHQVEVGIKEAYSILSNAIKMSEAEHGNITEWDYSTDEIVFTRRYIIPYLKIVKNCGPSRLARPYEPLGTCFAHKGTSKAFFETFSGLKPIDYTGQFYLLLLQNGMGLGVGVYGFTPYGAYFIVDIDGPNKGDSILGKDVFYFTLKAVNRTKHFSYLLPGIYDLNYGNSDAPENYTLNELLGSNLAGGCNLEATSNVSTYQGSRCAAAIAKNGWKIPDDYPVKKF